MRQERHRRRGSLPSFNLLSPKINNYYFFPWRSHFQLQTGMTLFSCSFVRSFVRSFIHSFSEQVMHGNKDKGNYASRLET